MLKKTGWMMMLATTTVAAAVAVAQEQLPTGASAAFTSSDNVVVEARRMLADGKFKEAEELLKANDDPQVPARAELVDVIRRIRHEYRLTMDGFVDKVRKSIPDVTKADVERWAKAEELRTKRIDGQTMVFAREPSNLFKLSKEAQARRVGFVPKDGFPLEKHLGQVAAAAAASGERYVLPVKHNVTYTVTVPGNTEGMAAGSVLRVWLPFPQEYARQRDVRLVEAAPSDVLVAPTKDDSQRTAYFEKRITDPTTPSTFKLRFEFTSYADYPNLDDKLVKPLPAEFPKRYTAERPPHIAFTPEVKRIVKEVCGDETNPLIKARRLWHWVDENIRYAYEDEYGTIASFTEKALTCRTGDCGVQGTTFITLARYAGVPARWQSGWQTKPGEINMHDWAEIYVEPWGWVAVDASYGRRKSDDPAVREFYLGHQDSYRMIVNFDYGRELYPPKKSLRSEPADFQRGEVELDGKNLYFDQWSYDIDVKTSPVDGK